jgi:hypothetical protein
VRSLRRLLVIGCVSALGLALAGAAPSASKPPPGQLVVIPSSARPGKQAGLELTLRSSTDAPAPARVTIYVPAGYGLTSSRTPGTVIGGVGALFVRTARPSVVHYVTGHIRQGNPARLALDRAAQACAPGSHEGVWIVTFKINKRPVTIRFYVDATAGAEASLGAFKLSACFASPYVPTGPNAPGGVRYVSLSLSLSQAKGSVFTNPAADGTYTWRMLVTPYLAGSGTPNPGARFEARARVQQPHTLTLRVRYLRKTSTLLITGRLLALGRARPGIRVRFYAGRPTGDLFHFGKVRTRADGRYSLLRLVSRRRLARVLYVGASINETRAPCDSPPAAVAGCVDENLSPPPFVAVAVRIPGSASSHGRRG